MRLLGSCALAAATLVTYDREEFERARDKMPQGVRSGPAGGPPM